MYESDAIMFAMMFSALLNNLKLRNTTCSVTITVQVGVRNIMQSNAKCNCTAFSIFILIYMPCMHYKMNSKETRCYQLHHLLY